ncbi:MAG: ABC transporter permease, partial [Pseudorhodobacter sp.]|nr:ABC transporter permease [Frankiaceae bacterium]
MTAVTAERRRARVAPTARVGLGMLLVLALVAVAAPLLAPHDPEAVVTSRVLGSPDLSHPFGSDVLGRDVLSRVMYALRISLLVSVAAV